MGKESSVDIIFTTQDKCEIEVNFRESDKRIMLSLSDSSSTVQTEMTIIELSRLRRILVDIENNYYG